MSHDDERHPFDADRFLDGFAVEERQVPVDPDSPLGRAMAEARESWKRDGVPDHDDFRIVPNPVTFDDE